MNVRLHKLCAYLLPLLYALFSTAADAGAQQIVQVGSDTTSNNLYSPIAFTGGKSGKNKHYQLLYTADDMKAQGFTGPAILDSVAFDITQVNKYAMPNFGIKMKNAGYDAIEQFDSIGLAQVHSVASYTSTLGWNWYAFQTPFVWDGVSNLLLDFCFDSIPSPDNDFTTSGKLRFDSKTQGRVRFRSITSQCGTYSASESHVNLPNMRFSFRKAPDCTGKPAAPALLPGGPYNICAGAPIPLTVLVSSFPAGMSYVWEFSVNNGNTWEKMANVTKATATFNPSVSTLYKVSVKCGDQVTASNVITVNVNSTGLVYKPVPYTQQFEEWQNRCDSLELPDVNWTSSPATGNQSWRREDQGASAKWTGTVVPSSYPVMAGDHSARFHTCSNVGEGSLSMYLDCSTPGGKELRFDYINKTGGLPRMDVMLSQDGGNTFTILQTLNSMSINAVWQPQVIPFESNSAKTVIRFRSFSYSQSGDYDMGINDLHVLEPCKEAPVAGEVDSNSSCSGSGMQLSLSGSTFSAGLEWLWQESTDGIGWTDVANGNIEHPSVSITQNTWYRCIVTCSNSGLKDTTAPRLLTVKPFYYCYCTSGSTSTSPSLNVGNVKLTKDNDPKLLLDNGNPLPATQNPEAKKNYSNFTDLAPADLFRDSSYKINLTFFTHNGTNVRPIMSSGYTAIYIDYNRDGVYDYAERLGLNLKAADIYEDSFAFKVPNDATIGITGMRIVTNTTTYDTGLIKPCGSFSRGEVEDYLVRINNLPCNGAEATGLILASDTSFCPGYPFSLTHMDADSTSGLISRVWQTSADGKNWNDIVNSENERVKNIIFDAPAYYRVKAECTRNSVVTATDSVWIGQDALCYCPSYATGGFAGMADSSDFGSFKMGNIDIPLTGGHLNNAAANSKYTSYTHLPAIEMYADSSYGFTLDHILIRNEHADAKITMFIDYNANGQYDVPEERVYTGLSALSTWRKNENITIPSDVALNKETGMRLVINNDTGANQPSDDACGTYVSGETEDYRVTFKKAKKEEVGVSGVDALSEAIRVYPNPSNGIVSILYTGNYKEEGSLKLQNIAGQTIETRLVSNLNNGTIMNLDLGGYSSGIYFITLECAAYKATVKVALQ